MQYQKEIEKLQDVVCNDPDLGDRPRAIINNSLRATWGNINTIVQNYPKALLEQITNEAVARGWRISDNKESNHDRK